MTTMNITEQHRSPDGTLRLVVSVDGVDTTIGFEGYSSHTHGDMLVTVSGMSEEAAVRDFVDRIIGNDQIIVLSRLAGKIRDVWISDDPEDELRYVQPEEI